jgi:magnesium-transporting ATPase (P-type)
MSVLVRTPDDRVMIVCKGADSIINARLQRDQPWIKETNEDLERYAEVGLRTLLIAYKYVDDLFYDKWVLKFKEAESSTQGRERLIGKCAEEIETDFLLAGCSAIEDKLQDDVGATIKDIRRAGIKVWVLTGDKVETAINIGQSC